jgi:hypothetical protein
MFRSWRRPAAFAPRWLLLALLLVPVRAAATEKGEGDKRTCVAASESAQRLRASHDLVAARDQLVVCSAADCPAVVQRYCGTWLGEVEALLPSVVLRVRDADGNDIEGARVTLDGASWSAAVDGRAAVLNPGAHSIGASVGDASAEQRVVIVEGERNRVVELRFSRPGNGAGGGSRETSAGRAAAPRRTSWLAPLLGGGSLAALGTFGVFGVLGADELATLHGTCGQTVSCQQRDVDAAVTKLRVADLALAVGVILAASALVATWLVQR